MKVFVTVTNNFIGSHLVEKLIKLGHKVKNFTFYNRGSNGWVDSIDKKLLKDFHIISGKVGYAHTPKQAAVDIGDKRDYRIAISLNKYYV